VERGWECLVGGDGIEGWNSSVRGSRASKRFAEKVLPLRAERGASSGFSERS
jgi:hypothetical protein